MDDAQTVLEQAGVPANHIHSERFNTSGSVARPRSSSDRNATRVAILLDGRRLDIEVGEQDDSILDAALRRRRPALRLQRRRMRHLQMPSEGRPWRWASTTARSRISWRQATY